MSGSYIFLFHLIGFSLVSTLVVAGWVLNIRFMREKDLSLKLYIAGIARMFTYISPVAASLLLITGIGNIYNLYEGAGVNWYEQSWLVIKVILFGVMLVNGFVFGPSLGKKRAGVLKQMIETGGSDEHAKTLNDLNGQIRWFFIVQTVLLIGITFFSAFGTSKHPGYF